MSKTRVLLAAVFFIIISLSISSLGMASSWYDGLPRAALDWIKSMATNASTMSPGSYSNTFGTTAITIVLYEDAEEKEIFAGSVTISGRGTKTYTDSATALAEINAAVALEDMQDAATPNSVAFSTADSSEDKAPLVSSETPVASADRTGLRIMENVIIPKAETKEQKQRTAELAGSKPKLIGGALTYEDFDYYYISGKTYEILAGLEKSSEEYSLGFFVPVSYVDVTSGSWTRLGTTGYIKKLYPKETCDLSIGVNAAVEQTWMDVDGVDNSFSYGAGPMASCTFDLKDIEIGLGANLLYMANTEYDSVSMLTTGVNIGVPMGIQFVLNLTAYRTDNFDSDSDYWQIGGTGTYFVSNVFSLVLGLSTVTGLDDFDSTAFHVGGIWRY